MQPIALSRVYQQKNSMYRLFIISLLLGSYHIGKSQSAHYTVDFTSHSDKRVNIKAEFKDFNTQNLSMFVHPSEGVPQGEAGFIDNLTASNSSGQLAVKYLDLGEWKVSGKNSGSFSINYAVKLEHDKYAWFEAGGLDEVSYHTEDGYFFTGYSLFLFPAIQDLQSLKNVTVSFILPENWKVSTPWTLANNSSYEVSPDLRYLLNNCLFVGSHIEEVIEVNGFELRMAYAKEMEGARDSFRKLMEETLEQTTTIFGGSLSSQYLIVLQPHDMTDGGAFRGSFSQIINGEINETSRVTWGHTMIHETIHLWNGLSLQPTTQEEWFKEGFTDYLSMLIESRSGINSPDLVLKRLEKMYSRYVIGKFIQRTPESLQQSGNRKQEIRSLVYGGGSLFALALDIELREATNNQKGLDDLMKYLFESFAQKGKTYSHQDILNAANTIANKDLSSLFSTYLLSTEFKDFLPYFQRIGLDAYPFLEELYLSISPQSTTEQTKIRNAIFGF